MSPPPEVSVVVASTTGGHGLVAALGALAAQMVSGTVEVLVAVPDDVAERLALVRNFPDVRVIQVAHPTTVPQLYAAGLLAAQADCVAMTNDACVPDGDWVAAVRRAHAGRTQPCVIGGAIVLTECAPIVARAAFYAEYGRFAPPFQRGAAVAAAGANVSYNRATLHQLRPLLARPVWEYLWHRTLADAGVAIERDPSIVVHYVRPWTLGSYLRERYHYSRAFAGSQDISSSRGTRLVRGLIALCLPPVLFVRTVRTNARHGSRLIPTLPLLALFTLPWSWGEAVGHWLGAGESAHRVGLA